MRPFFSYYGAKWTGAKHYGPPRHDLVIEPFAGSASYATRWDCPRVKLYDVSQDICDLWDWLIGCSIADVENIPVSFEDYVEVHGLRKNAVIALLEAGCSVAETAAVSGQSFQMVEYYAKLRDQKKLSSAAILKWENKTRTGKR